MTQIKVTQSLRDTIKKYRKDIHLRGDSLSRELKKNTSFISQLENGKIETIDLDILNKIFDILFKDDSPESKTKKYNEILQQLQIVLSDEELKKQEWLTIMDLQYRMIPIPQSIIDYINDKLQKLQLSPEEIIIKVNKNESLFSSYTQEEIEQMDNNKVYCSISDKGENIHIKFQLPLDYLSKILQKKILRCNFITMQAIIHSIFVIEGFDYDTAYDNSENFLFSNRFYTLLKKQHFPKDEPEKYLAQHDIDFKKKLNHLVSVLSTINDNQPEFLNPILDALIKNLKREPALTLSTMQRDVTVLKTLSRDQKRQFIKDYEALISNYKENSSSTPPKIETF